MTFVALLGVEAQPGQDYDRNEMHRWRGTPTGAQLTTRRVLFCAAVVLTADVALWLVSPPLWVDALLDEPAHAATALLALGAVGYAFDARFVLALLAGSILIDVDHLPGFVGWDVLEQSATRPYPHTLLTPLLVLGAALIVRGRARLVLLAVWLGLICHFARDLAEPQTDSPGVALLWPLSGHSFVVPYVWYGVVIAALTAVCLRAWPDTHGRPRCGATRSRRRLPRQTLLVVA